jgi:hypothetical protein
MARESTAPARPAAAWAADSAEAPRASTPPDPAPSRPVAARQLPPGGDPPLSPASTPQPRAVVAPPREAHLQDVRVTSSGSGRTVIELRGRGLRPDAAFLLRAPNRYVLDFRGAQVERTSTVPVGSPLVQRVRIGQFSPPPDPVLRVVFDLEGLRRPGVEEIPGGLRVTFQGE